MINNDILAQCVRAIFWRLEALEFMGELSEKFILNLYSYNYKINYS